MTKTAPTPRKRLRFMALSALCCLTVGGAQAAWEVNDRNTQQEIRDLKSDTNERLDNIHNSMKIGSAAAAGDPKPEPEPTDASEKLDHTSMSSVAITADERCPAASAGGLAAQQRTLCQQLIDTEKAKYMYSLRMYKLTEERWDRLKQIQQEREDIGEEDFGKLEDNSNKLLSLLALMEIDQEQHKVYMAAYDARLSYLTAARDTLSRRALEGSNTAAGWASTAVAGGVLYTALELAKSQRDGDWKSHKRQYGISN